MQNNIQSYESSDGDVKKILGVDANIHETRKDARNEKNEISNQIQSALKNGMLNLSNFDISKWSLSSSVDKLTDALELNPEYTEYIKKFNLKDTHTHDNIAHNLDTNKINKLGNLLKKTKSRKIQEKFDKLKVNLVEQAIHSQIESNSDPTSLFNEIVNTINIALEDINNNFEKRFQEGGAESNNTKEDVKSFINIITNKLKFEQDYTNTLLDFFEKLNMPEMSKSFKKIKEEINSDSIDRKITTFENENIKSYGIETAEKYKDFKFNLSKLEILALIEKYKKIAEKEGLLSESNIEGLFEEFLDLVNQTTENNNEMQKDKHIIKGGSVVKYSKNKSNDNSYVHFLKYKKYKKKYMILQSLKI